MQIDIKLHKNDLPDEIEFSDKIAIDCEFTGLNIQRDRLCLVQLSNGKNDAHIIQLDRSNYEAPNLAKILQNDKSSQEAWLVYLTHAKLNNISEPFYSL